MFEFKKQTEPKPLSETLLNIGCGASPIAVLSAIVSKTFLPSELLEAKHMRGFEEEWRELERTAVEHSEILRAAFVCGDSGLLSDADEMQARKLVSLAKEARSIFKTRGDVAAYERVRYLVRAAKLDEKFFMRLLQAFIFIEDAPLNSLTVVENFMRAENAASPEIRWLIKKGREEKEEQRWQKTFHETGLDGSALMALLKMKPGPDFGLILKQIQSAARGTGELPRLPSNIVKELCSRIGSARDKMSIV
jgi:hypothetical protein